jgi:hypothetical protein
MKKIIITMLVTSAVMLMLAAVRPVPQAPTTSPRIGDISTDNVQVFLDVRDTNALANGVQKAIHSGMNHVTHSVQRPCSPKCEQAEKEWITAAVNQIDPPRPVASRSPARPYCWPFCGQLAVMPGGVRPE